MELQAQFFPVRPWISDGLAVKQMVPQHR
jgi:hypothetical protein